MAASTCEQTGRARMTKVRVGLVGTGFVAELHMYAYKRVYGVGAEVVAAVSRSDQVETFAQKHKIAQTYRHYRALLADPAIDVVDICTPPALHAQMIIDAVRAGKHVICEKPLTGYFGRPGDPAPIGTKVPKAAMYEHVMAELKDLRAAIENSGKLCMPKTGSMRRRWRRPSKSSTRPATRSCS
jgi:hypothetical protein